MTEEKKGILWACAMCGHVVATSGEQPTPLHWDDGHICGPWLPWEGDPPRRPRPKEDLFVDDGVIFFSPEEEDEDGETVDA